MGQLIPAVPAIAVPLAPPALKPDVPPQAASALLAGTEQSIEPFASVVPTTGAIHAVPCGLGTKFPEQFKPGAATPEVLPVPAVVVELLHPLIP